MPDGDWVQTLQEVIAYGANIGRAVFSVHCLGFRDKSWSIMTQISKYSENNPKIPRNIAGMYDMYWQAGSKYGMVCVI